MAFWGIWGLCDFGKLLSTLFSLFLTLNIPRLCKLLQGRSPNHVSNLSSWKLDIWKCCELENVRSTHFGNLNFWEPEILKHWNFGKLTLWNFWNFGSLELWNFEIWNFDTLHLWKFRTVKLWNFGTLKLWTEFLDNT